MSIIDTTSLNKIKDYIKMKAQFAIITCRKFQFSKSIIYIRTLHKNKHVIELTNKSITYKSSYQVNIVFAICKTIQSKINDEIIHKTLNTLHVMFDIDNYINNDYV